MGRLFAFVLLLFCALSYATTTAAARPIQTAVAGERAFTGTEAGLAFARVRAAGATAVRLGLLWKEVAKRSPASATNPADPAYQWASFDRQVRLAVMHGLRPIVQIVDAPAWAQGKPSGSVRPDPVDARFRGSFRPSPVAFGRFARAAATRYSGGTAGLPRVRHWQAWNEPNVSGSLMPQFIGKRTASPSWYRTMLNEFAVNVHAVRRDNLVIAGGLSPFTVKNAFTIAIGPLRFMREVLCLSGGKTPKATCNQRARFDIWAHHPYTSGGPTRHAYGADDVSLGDLPEMQRLLQTGVRRGKVLSRRQVGFWITEFSWDTKPPDPHARAVPIKLHARWVSEALYRVWKAGVSLVAWFQLRDDAYPQECCQSGLYFRRGSSLRTDQPKPAFQAFRFPFVAYRERAGVYVWGRTSTSRAAQVVVEQTSGKAWKRVGTLRANAHGVFSARMRLASPRATSSPRRITSAVASYSQTVRADEPTAYWRLGDTSGTVARNEEPSSPGTYLGGVKLGVAGALVRDRNRAASFDGRNDRVSVGGVGSPEAVELWVRTEATRTNPGFSNRNTINHYVFLGTLGSGNALAYDLVEFQGAKWVTDGRWHHVVYTYERGAGRLYVDGTLDSTAQWTRVEGGGPAHIAFDVGFGYFRGSIDEVAVYHHALTPTQVKRHYDASGQRIIAGDQFQIMGKGTYLRARLVTGGEASLPFSLTRPPDRYVLPFGGGG
ncbi:MAG: hypothetical protein H0U03_09020 [Actinobacteria bacterium]|nr:hypothetical protein [Actinomycetota bacterium]